MRHGRIGSVAALGLLLGLAACQPPRPALPQIPVTLSIQPVAATVTEGRAFQFGYRLSAPFPGVSWRVLEPAGGIIDAQGRYQAPDRAGVWTVEVRAQADAARIARAQVTVVPPPKGSISAPSVIAPEASGLRASVPDQPGCRFAWALEGGTILAGTDTDTLTFRAAGGPRLTLRCQITNAAGDIHTAILEVPVSAPLPLVIAPAQAVLTVGQAMTFGYRMTGDSPGVVWRVPNLDGGTVDGKGFYRAPEVPGLYTLLAAPMGHPDEGGQARIKVVPAPVAPITAPDRLVARQMGCRASVPVQPGASYTWEIRGGVLTSGIHDPVATFMVAQVQELTLRCTVRNEAGDAFTGVVVIPVGR
jgi:hypothetical protein